MGMLVLSRKLNEKIVINLGHRCECTLTVIDIRGDKVRLGFEAPPDVQIWRTELLAEVLDKDNTDGEARTKP